MPMPRSQATVATRNAGRYLQQLCKHWSHKFDTSVDLPDGTIDMGDGRTVAMQARDGALHVAVSATDGDALPRLEGVVADHLARFGFREQLSFDWKRDG
jgi:uncharacterized protein